MTLDQIHAEGKRLLALDHRFHRDLHLDLANLEALIEDTARRLNERVADNLAHHRLHNVSAACCDIADLTRLWERIRTRQWAIRNRNEIIGSNA